MTDPEKEEQLEKFILESVMVFEIPIVFPDFVQFFQDKLKQIPKEYRQNSLIWIPITQDDGGLTPPATAEYSGSQPAQRPV